MDKTQDHLSFKDICDNLVLLKDGSASIILQTSAVNFGLLSEREQMAIISSFAQMLNSLSFSIQIVIASQKLDISSYIHLLDQAQTAQTNSLLAQMMSRYRSFIQSTVKENEVLDKRFYLVITVSYLELGIGFISQQERVKRAQTILIPRRDHILRQLNRFGLKAKQLTTEDLAQTLYLIYNNFETALPVQIEPVRLDSPNLPKATQPAQVSLPANQSEPTTSGWAGKNHPFVVEELADNT